MKWKCGVVNRYVRLQPYLTQAHITLSLSPSLPSRLISPRPRPSGFIINFSSHGLIFRAHPPTNPFPHPILPSLSLPPSARTTDNTNMTTVAAAYDEEEWMELAARDDHLVAELLLRLRRAVPPPALPIDWSVRQPRSVGPKEEEEEHKKKRRRRRRKQTQTQTQTQSKEEGVEPTRASPATPLSWSGATSTSGGGGDGHEESSRPAWRPPYNARSKVSTLTATPSHMTPATRRPKRKKTLPELKEEESLLLRERRNLRHELAALRLIIEQERAKNDIFKQKRLGLQLLRATTISASDMRADCEPLKISSEERDNIGIATQRDTQADNIFVATRGERREMMYELPDLNVPLEEDHGT